MGRVFTNFAASLVQSVRKRCFTRTLQRQETSGHHCWYKYSPTSCSKVCCHSVVTEVCGNRCLGSGPCAIRENIEQVSVVLNKPADDMDSNLSVGCSPTPALDCSQQLSPGLCGASTQADSISETQLFPMVKRQGVLACQNVCLDPQ